MTREQELHIISRAKKHPRFFAPLYESYFENIFRFVHRKVGCMETAADLCSQTFEKALMSIDKYEDRGFPFSSWLYRIAANEVNMHYRKQQKELHQELNEEILAGLMHEFDISLEKEEQILLLLSTLSVLDQKEQELIEARFFDALSFKEMGGLFGLSEEAAKMRTYRALKSLREKMKGASDE